MKQALSQDVFEVLSVNGDVELGGEDFDWRIVDFLLEQFKSETGIDLRSDKSAIMRLKEAAETAKVTLSGLTATNIYVPYLSANDHGIKHLDVTLTRSRFEELTSDLVDKTIICCKRALQDATFSGNYTTANIEELVLVGLSTKIPSVRQAVSRFFGREPRRGVDPDEAVALGAAIQAGVLGGATRDVLLLDVISQSLGVEVYDGKFLVVVPRNTTIPIFMTKNCTTIEDGQTSIQFNVLEGEAEKATQNRSLGYFSLDGLTPTPAGKAEIEVKFSIDANGFTIVSAKDMVTGKEERRSFHTKQQEPFYLGKIDTPPLDMQPREGSPVSSLRPKAE